MKDQKIQFIDLRATGKTYIEISKVLGVSKQTLINWSKELELELSNAKSIQRDKLVQHYSDFKQSRFDAHTKLHDLLLCEIEKRDLSSIPTEKLISILIKNSNEAEKMEIAPVKFAAMECEFFNLTDTEVVKTWEA